MEADDQNEEEYDFNDVENSLEPVLAELLAEESAGPEAADLYLLDQHISAEDKLSPIVNPKARVQHAKAAHGRHHRRHTVQLEGITVRHQPLPPLEKGEGPRKASHSVLKDRNPSQQLAPIPTIHMNLLEAIPEQIRTQALFKSGGTVAPRRRLRSISTRRATELDRSHKAKKVEDISTILNRVVRANCCLEP